MTEDEVVEWHHQLKVHEFEKTLGDSEGQGSLACCNPWGHKGLDMLVTEQQCLFSLFFFTTNILYGIESFQI